jgi:hypothetical protein
MYMDKLDYLYIILDNVMAFSIRLSPEYQGNGLTAHLERFDERALKVIAGFNKSFLKHFLDLSKGKSQMDIEETLKKMELISYMIGPIGNLHYLGEEQVQFVLSKLNSLKIDEINEAKISLLADDHLRQQFGSNSGGYSAADALENQLASAAFYLINMGYSREEIQQKFNDVRQNPSKLGDLFNLPEKEIYNMPDEIQYNSNTNSGSMTSSEQQVLEEQTQTLQEAMEHHVKSIHEDINEERAQKVEEILNLIKSYVKDEMSELQEKVFKQMHPDRLNRAYKMLRETKRKSKRMELLIEWFTASLLLSKIELKVEHWQVSSNAGHGSAGVYTAGIDFSRYDPIVKEFPDNKLEKVLNIARRILQKPSKKAIQKLGQDLIAETGFDEHLYFTD